MLVWSMNQTQDPQILKVDLLKGPKQPPFKSPLVERTNKIFQKRFGIVLQLIFPYTKIGCTINKKWCLCKQNHFVFWSSLKNASEPYCQKWAKNSISPKITVSLTWPEDQMWLLCEKNHFWFSSEVKKMPNLGEIEFFAHFRQYGSEAIFRLEEKTKSNFFRTNITSY